MAGNASTVKIGIIDWTPASYLAAPTGTIAPFIPTVTASTTQAGYSAANVLAWDRSKWKSTNTIATDNLTIDMSAMTNVFGYDYVFIWLHNVSTGLDYNTSADSDLKLYTSTTGAFAGEEVLEFTITAAEFYANSFTSYNVVANSRMLALPTLATRSNTVERYIRIEWTKTAACSIELAKVSVQQMTPFTEIVDKIDYIFKDRDVYNAKENGGYTQYQRDYARMVAFKTKYLSSTVNIFKKTNYLTVNDNSIPYILMLDADNTWESAGQHMHTMPCLWRKNAQYRISQQFSKSGMYADLPFNFDEYL